MPWSIIKPALADEKAWHHSHWSRETSKEKFKVTIRFTQEHNGGAGALSQGPKMFFLPLQDLFPAA
jgi:hypothetical protein